MHHRKKNIDHGAVPRPCNLLNQTTVRFGVAERVQCEPKFNQNHLLSSALPFYQFDNGQSGPRYVKRTTTCAPADQNLQNVSKVPFGFIVQPLAEMSQDEFSYCDDGTNGEVPFTEIDCRQEGEEVKDEPVHPTKPLRCKKCMGYMCLHTVFIAAGHQA